jgi:hypothetical protein
VVASAAMELATAWGVERQHCIAEGEQLPSPQLRKRKRRDMWLGFRRNCKHQVFIRSGRSIHHPIANQRAGIIGPVGPC